VTPPCKIVRVEDLSESSSNRERVMLGEHLNRVLRSLIQDKPNI